MSAVRVISVFMTVEPSIRENDGNPSILLGIRVAIGKMYVS